MLLPTDVQLRALIEGESGDVGGRIQIGVCPTAGGEPVHVDPDKLFGRHLAVLGNTGAGKSCTVAGLVRWSHEAAQEARAEGNPNARFIILDHNGEYARAFSDLSPRVFQVEGSGSASALKVPAWLWNGEEWSAFTGAAPGVQRPILFDAIRRLRSGAGEPDAFATRVRGRVRRYRTELSLRIQRGDHLQLGRREGVAQLLINLASDFEELAGDSENPLYMNLLQTVVDCSRNLEEAARGQEKQDGGFWHNDFAEVNLGEVQQALKAMAQQAGLSDEDIISGEDTPKFFPARELPRFVEALAADAAGRDVSQFVDSLNLRIRGLFAAGPLASIADPGHVASSLEEWLKDHVGADQAANGPLAVLDLSLVPSEAVHVVVAVLARMVFEAVQRHRRLTGGTSHSVGA